jgi:hypothetical protein
VGRKVRISNGQVSELGADRAGTERDAQRRQNAKLQQKIQSDANNEKEPSEFQKFIADNTGKMLPIFGSEFFANTPSTFAPISNSLVRSILIIALPSTATAQSRFRPSAMCRWLV